MVEAVVRERLVEALRQGNRDGSEALVAALIEGGTPVRAIYDLFTDALHDIGRLWERGEVGVAVEHVATAIVETLLARVFPEALRRPPNGLAALVSCAADEFHQVGGRIVADVLELRGWSVTFIGADVSVSELVTRAIGTRPALVALSVSIPVHVANVVRAVTALRVARIRAPIVVGGQGLDARTTPRLAALDDVTCCASLPELEGMLARWEGP